MKAEALTVENYVLVVHLNIREYTHENKTKLNKCIVYIDVTKLIVVEAELAKRYP